MAPDLIYVCNTNSILRVAWLHISPVVSQKRLAVFVVLKKDNFMDASDLKMRIIKEIDSLESSKLEMVYGYTEYYPW